MGKLFLVGIFLLSTSVHSGDVILQEALKFCGTEGTIKERVQDCLEKNKELALRPHDWVLVTKAPPLFPGTLNESWMQEGGSLVWLSPILNVSTREQVRATYSGALKICQNRKLWLPSREEFDAASDAGLRDVLPQIRRGFYWTGTVSRFPRAAYFYNALRGYTDDGNQSETHRVLCALKIK